MSWAHFCPQDGLLARLTSGGALGPARLRYLVITRLGYPMSWPGSMRLLPCWLVLVTAGGIGLLKVACSSGVVLELEGIGPILPYM